MNNSSAGHRFAELPAEGQAHYRKVLQQMVRLARDHAIPIIFAPPLGIGGEVKGATGSVVQLSSGSFVLTASHVLGSYERRLQSGEVLNWQLGNLPPFDPLPRVVWRDLQKDVVLLRLSAEEVARVGPCIVSTPDRWPPPVPNEGDLVLVAGYPKALREIDSAAGWIGAGPYSAMLRVTATGEGYCKCRIEQKDLVSCDGGPLPDPGTDLGSLSGGPVLLVARLSYPLVGVITEQCHMSLADFGVLQIATLENVLIG